MRALAPPALPPASAAGAPSPLQPQVAIFLDEVSAATRTLSDLGAAFVNEMIRAPQYLAAAGAPTRIFLLSDLLRPESDWSGYTLFVFADAFVTDEAMRRAVDRHCRHHNATLLWQYAPGVYTALNATPSEDAVSALVGLPLARGAGALNLRLRTTDGIEYYDDPALPAADPWFCLDESDPAASQTEVLGRLVAAPEGATGGLLRRSGDGHTSLFSAAPGMPPEVFRGLAKSAGVHLYLECVGDIVEVRPPAFLLVHAAAVCGSGPRRVSLPAPASAVRDESGATVCAGACDRFTTGSLEPGEAMLFTLEWGVVLVGDRMKIA